MAEIIFDTLIGEWMANVVVDGFEANLVLKNDKLKIVTFRDDGTFFLSDYAAFTEEVRVAKNGLSKVEDEDD